MLDWRFPGVWKVCEIYEKTVGTRYSFRTIPRASDRWCMRRVGIHWTLEWAKEGTRVRIRQSAVLKVRSISSLVPDLAARQIWLHPVSLQALWSDFRGFHGTCTIPECACSALQEPPSPSLQSCFPLILDRGEKLAWMIPAPPGAVNRYIHDHDK